ncbi:MAG: thiamine pyrophosphate-binding protein [Caldilineaceae bacterium]|nr:thiamine pyrophosphate-binding protein [Caldilineaceae bacterium]MDE0340121.1 thiamine pyrophosphate-binding protein [Caldilineaceae bacterium]
MSTIRTGGEALVQGLLSHGIDTIFGLPGVQNDHFYSAVYDAGYQIRAIQTRHEQGAAYMALGYALASGKTGVYVVVPGPGFLNTTAALATAYATHAPVLCLAGQIHSDQIGRGYGMLHEIPDQLTVMRSLTKWARRAESPGEIPQLLATALCEMRSGRPRPVGLESPIDVLAGKAEMSDGPIPLTVRRPEVDTDAIEEAARLMGKARNPVIFVGGGAIDAGEEVRALAEALQAPVIASGRGRGILSSRHPFSHTYAAGEPLWKEADLAIAIGTRLTKPFIQWQRPRHLSLIRIEIAPQESSFLAPADVTVAADSKDALRALLPVLARYNRQRPSRTAEMFALHKEMEDLFDSSFQPQIDFIRAIRDTLPDDGIFVDELTQVGYASNMAMPVYQPRTFLTPNYQGTLGWGFPTALGAKVAAPDRPVLSIAGDGGFLYCAVELATAVQHGINTVSVVFNDGAYGNVRRMQKELYDGRIISSDLVNPDFVAFVESFGAIGVRVHSANSLRDALTDAFAADRPVVIEVPVGEMPGPWRMMYPNELMVED